MIKAVVANSAAGIAHPSDPSLRIPVVALVTPTGAPANSNMVTDTTGQYMFDLGSLPCVPHYDANGNMDWVTYGPDIEGRSIRQTTTWTNGVWMGDSGWVLQ